MRPASRQATKLFATHFERAGLPNMANRVKYASAFTDTGGGQTQFAFDDTGGQPAAAPATQVAATDQTHTGAIADDQSGGQTDDQNVAVQSPQIDAPVVDLTPQVQDPQLVEDPNQVNYAMGGAIEDDTQYFVAGGKPNPCLSTGTNQLYAAVAGKARYPALCRTGRNWHEFCWSELAELGRRWIAGSAEAAHGAGKTGDGPRCCCCCSQSGG